MFKDNIFSEHDLVLPWQGASVQLTIASAAASKVKLALLAGGASLLVYRAQQNLPKATAGLSRALMNVAHDTWGLANAVARWSLASSRRLVSVVVRHVKRWPRLGGLMLWMFPQDPKGIVARKTQDLTFLDMVTPRPEDNVTVDPISKMAWACEPTSLIYEGYCIICHMSECECDLIRLEAISPVCCFAPANTLRCKILYGWLRYNKSWRLKGDRGKRVVFDKLRNNAEHERKARASAGSRDVALCAGSYAVEDYSVVEAMLGDCEQSVAKYSTTRQREALRDGLRLMRKHVEFYMRLKIQTMNITYAGRRASRADRLALMYKVVRAQKEDPSVSDQEFLRMCPVLMEALLCPTIGMTELPFEIGASF